MIGRMIRQMVTREISKGVNSAVRKGTSTATERMAGDLEEPQPIRPLKDMTAEERAAYQEEVRVYRAAKARRGQVQRTTGTLASQIVRTVMRSIR